MNIQPALVLQLKDLLKEENLKKMYVIVSKTKSYWNKDLNDLPRIRAVVALYLTKNPKIGNFKVKIIPDFPNAYWEPYQKFFGFGLFNADIIAHEIEHCLSMQDSPLYTDASVHGYNLGQKVNVASTFALLLASLKNPKSDFVKNIVPIAKGSTLASMGLVTPRLYEEGKANALATSKSKDKWESIKNLGPAYATYLLAGLGIPLATRYGLNKVIKLRNKN